MGISNTYTNMINLLQKQYTRSFGSIKKKCFTTYYEEEEATVYAPHLMVTHLVYCSLSYEPIKNKTAQFVLLHILNINNSS